MAVAAILLIASCTGQTRKTEATQPVVTENAASQEASTQDEKDEEPSVALQIVGGVVVGALIVVGSLVLAVLSASDARLKTDISRIGDTPSGLPLYTFRYRGDRRIWRGVMAQDVLRHTPDAVVRSSDGYLYVRYARLGLRMKCVGRIKGRPPEGERRIRRWRFA